MSSDNNVASVDAENRVLKVNFDNRIVEYDITELDELVHAYATTIHKSQGLEYDSVKIVIADDSENKITHDIFYTAITRARQKLMIYWSPEVCNRILAKIRPQNNNKDIMLLKSKYTL